MFKTKPLLQFVVVFFVIYILAMVSWQFIGPGYENLFRSFWQSIFHDFRDSGIVKLIPFDFSDIPGQEQFHTKLWLENPKKGAASAGLSCWYTGFLPTMLVVALIMATPLSFKRRGWALLWGLILVNVFIWFQLYIQILYEFDRNEFLGVLSFGPFWDSLVSTLHYLFVESMGTTFIAPVFIWMLVTFRKGDLEEFFKNSATKSGSR